MPDSTLTQNESNGGIITPIVCVRPVCMPLTSRLRRQPSWREASSTRRHVSSPNRSRSPRRIRDAAASETLAALATSFRRGTGELAICAAMTASAKAGIQRVDVQRRDTARALRRANPVDTGRNRE